MNEGGSGEKESVAAGDAWLHRCCCCSPCVKPYVRVCVCVCCVTERASQLADNRDECMYSVTQEQMVNSTQTAVSSSTCRGRYTLVKGLATCKHVVND